MTAENKNTPEFVIQKQTDYIQSIVGNTQIIQDAEGITILVDN